MYSVIILILCSTFPDILAAFEGMDKCKYLKQQYFSNSDRLTCSTERECGTIQICLLAEMRELIAKHSKDERTVEEMKMALLTTKDYQQQQLLILLTLILTVVSLLHFFVTCANSVNLANIRSGIRKLINFIVKWKPFSRANISPKRTQHETQDHRDAVEREELVVYDRRSGYVEIASTKTTKM